MTYRNFDAGYAGYRGYGYAVHLCVAREGGLPPSHYPMPTPVKTTEEYVTYVTPVTDNKFLVWALGRNSEVDLLFNDYGFLCPWIAVFSSPEPRRNGLRRYHSNLRISSLIFLVIIVSPRRNIRTHSENYVEFSPVIF